MYISSPNISPLGQAHISNGLLNILYVKANPLSLAPISVNDFSILTDC